MGTDLTQIGGIERGTRNPSYATLLRNPAWAGSIAVSLEVSILTTVIVLVLGALAAYPHAAEIGTSTPPARTFPTGTTSRVDGGAEGTTRGVDAGSGTRPGVKRS